MFRKVIKFGSTNMFGSDEFKVTGAGCEIRHHMTDVHCQNMKQDNAGVDASVHGGAKATL